MRHLGKLFAHIPARAGSKRVPVKNLRLLNGKPLIAYAIECAKAAGCFDKIYVNTDSPTIGALARKMGVEYYQRSEELASDDASGDDFTADFMEKTAPDTLVMVSPVCPLVEPRDVLAALERYQESDCDTLITCDTTQLQTFCQNRPVNIELGVPLAPTQENPSVEILNWAVTIWDCPTFLKSYQEYRGGYIGTRRTLLPIDPLKTVKISKEEDFRLASALLSAKRQQFPGDDEAEECYWEETQPAS